MKKIQLVLFFEFLLLSNSFAQNVVKIKEKPFNGKELYRYVSLVHLAETPSSQTYIENHLPWKGKGDLSIYINLDRLKEYDSVLNLAIQKFEEWKKVLDSTGTKEIKKEMPYTFLTDGSMINDYGFSSGGNVQIKFVFKRRQSINSPKPTDILEISAFSTIGPRSGIYLVRLIDEPAPESYWEISDQNNQTVKVFSKPPKKTNILYEKLVDDFDLQQYSNSPNFKQQVQLYKDLLDYSYVLSQIEEFNKNQSILK
jgi:hypothetical protein